MHRFVLHIGPVMYLIIELIDLYATVDGANERQTWQESNGTSKDEVSKRQNCHVTEVNHRCHLVRHHEPRFIIDNTVSEHIKRRRAARQERTPPPPVIFRADLEIAHHNGNFSARDDENDHHECQEPKDVIELLEPNASENEEKLDKHCTERQNTPDKNGNDIVHVPRLQRNLTWNFVRAHRLFEWLSLEAHIASHERQWYGDAEP